MLLINGQYQTQLSVSDRGFQYGDGVFETLEIINGQLLFLDEHLQRLTLGCKKLRLPMPAVELLIFEADKLSKDCEHGVLKIILTRGIGGRGYQQPQPIQVTRIFSLHPYPDYSSDFQKLGINVRICQQRLGLNPSLAGIKHLNRLEQVLARSEWNDTEIQEGVMLDIDGNVIEGTMTNIFFIRDKILYTPSLEQAGIAGIMRNFILQTAQKIDIQIIQARCSITQLFAADEIFMTNSVIGIWPVKNLVDRLFNQRAITQQFQDALTNYKQQFYVDIY